MARASLTYQQTDEVMKTWGKDSSEIKLKNHICILRLLVITANTDAKFFKTSWLAYLNLTTAVWGCGCSFFQLSDGDSEPEM